MRTTNDILDRAYALWCGAAGIRMRRERFKRFTYGDQWCDLWNNGEGKYMREDEYAKQFGHHPITNNLMRKLVKTVVGYYRNQCEEQKVYSASELSAFAQSNSLAELDARMLEEFLISGCAVQRVDFERRFYGTGVWVDNVNPARFFVNRFEDPRGNDITMVGQLHDMSWAEVVNRFANGSAQRARELKELFKAEAEVPATPAVGEAEFSRSFFSPAAEGMCRVIEVWSFDSRETSDADGRLTMDFAWHCRWFAPDGTVLREYDSPFPHKLHPFVVKFYPLTDGEVHPFIEDVMDQQLCINRMVTLIDDMMATSAKGVLVFPLDQLPVGWTLQDIADTWARTDGVIPVTGRGSYMPQQVLSNPAAAGSSELLQLQLKLFQDISGVGDTLMGRTDTTARGIEMLNARLRNEAVALADLYQTFAAFTGARNYKAQWAK